MASSIYHKNGKEIYPEVKAPTTETMRLIKKPDCVVAVYTDQTQSFGLNHRVVLSRGYALFVRGISKGDINTLTWHEKTSTSEFYARLVQEIEQKLDKQNLIILVR